MANINETQVDFLDIATVFLNVGEFTKGYLVGIAKSQEGLKPTKESFDTVEDAVGQIVAIVRDSDIKQILIYGFPTQRDYIASLLSAAIDQVIPEKSSEINIFFNQKSRQGVN